MKKTCRIMALVVALCMMVTALSGCNESKATPPTNGAATEAGSAGTADPKEVSIKIATGQTGGAYYPIGISLGRC
jgi:TRAP-type uncharacterized transport system substrate-binding protein